MNEQQWPADKVERRSVSELVPYARNARTHSEKQVAQIAASIREWGWTIPVLIDETGTIIAGHGRVLAALKLGLEDVPCMTAVGWTESQRRAYVIADNKLALAADWDEDLLKVELEGLAELGFDLGLAGFPEAELTALLNPPDTYSRKVVAPIYEPRDEAPPISQMIDETKTESLKADINAADLPDDVRDFLLRAAERHTVFNFHRIADFYAAAEPDVQRLMEASALVIIDFDAAIENGFVALNEHLEKLALEQRPADAAEMADA
jgi:ParB-like chromosome segregation protein Spo0J